MNDSIAKILAAASEAPSGENAQPWRFVIRGAELFVYNLPERDQSLYNFAQRGSYVAHGALLENIRIAAVANGQQAKWRLFPNSSEPNLVAVVSFFNGPTDTDGLYPAIFKRCTNRKPYQKIPLTGEQRAALLSAVADLPGQVRMTEQPADIVALALVGSMNERIVFENKLLHDFLFSHITWTEAEAAEKKFGFYIKTLEMPGPAEFSFKLFRHWPIVNTLNRLGLSKAIWKQNGRTYAASSVIGIVTVDGDRPLDFVNAGIITERVWLTTTKLGLSFHPMTGVLFFMQRLLAGQGAEFSASQVKLIENSFAQVKRIFNIDRGTIPMMFRIGYGGEPSARSAKLPPVIVNEQSTISV